MEKQQKLALLIRMSLITFMEVTERNEQKTRMILLHHNMGIKKCQLIHHKMDVHVCACEQRVDAPCPSFKPNFCSFPPALSQNIASQKAFRDQRVKRPSVLGY